MREPVGRTNSLNDLSADLPKLLLAGRLRAAVCREPALRNASNACQHGSRSSARNAERIGSTGEA